MGPVSPHTHELLFSVRLLSVAAILIGAKWYYIVVFIVISLMISVVKHFFMLLAVFILFLEEYLFKSFAHFKISLVVCC